ncbi:MAG: PorV/PorQ family protein, partial [Bacteroidia bacterium]
MNWKSTLFALLFPLGLSAQFFPNLGGQRAGISAFSFLKIDASPRSAAMGGASSCLTGDAFSTFTNPATFAEIQNFTVGFSNTFWAAGTNYSYLSAGGRTKLGNFAGSMGFLTSGAMPVRTEFQPDGTGEMFYANYYSFGVTYAKKLTDYFSYGATLRVVHEQLAQYAATTGTVDIGFLYRTDYKDLSFAVNVQ